MRDPVQFLSTMTRPQLLIRAARFGLVDYDRKRALRRLVPGGGVPCPTGALARLIEIEEVEEDRRARQAADYSAVRHVELLIALMAEARLAAAFARAQDQAKASGSAALRRVT